MADYQFTIQSVGPFGAGTDIHIGLEGIDGLGVPDSKTQDVEWAHRDGSYANPEYLQMRVVTIPIVIRAATASDAMDDLTFLESVCTPQASDVPLVITLPGWGTGTMYGRPRSLKADFTHMRFGVIHALLRFDCPNPTIYF